MSSPAFGKITNTLNDGRILECNEAFARILGYDSPEACRAQHVLDLTTAPDDQPSLADRLAANGTVLSTESSVPMSFGNSSG